MPRHLKLAWSFVLLVGAAPLLIFGARTTVASWLVFPSPELNPVPEGAARLRTAIRLAPSEASYRFRAAELLADRFQRHWLETDAPTIGTQAARLADEARALLPTNPFYQRAAGSILLSLATHPLYAEDARLASIRAATDRFGAALSAWPRSPMVHRLVGLDLMDHWGVLPEDARGLALGALRVALQHDARRFRGRILIAVWTHAITPAMPAAAPPAEQIRQLLSPLEELVSGPESVQEIARFATRMSNQLDTSWSEALEAWRNELRNTVGR